MPHSSMNKSLYREPIGLFHSSQFELTTGSCQDCRTPPQALWYFQDEIIGIPKPETASSSSTSLPFLVWLGSSEVLQHGQLDKSGSHFIMPNGTKIPLQLTPKLPSNRSFYNHTTLQYFQRRSLRLRGDFKRNGETTMFVAKMIWPEDFRLDLIRNPSDPSRTQTSLTRLIEDQHGGASAPFVTEVLWERNPASPQNWAHRPIFGLMLNGAQGDDDEAHGGHFGLVTGQMGSTGEMANWMMNNFYDLDIESEKGIIPSMLPLDHYLMDLNSGQSYYRPSYLLIAILRQDRAANFIQASASNLFREFYRHDFLYHHAKANCTGLSIDILRDLGWAIPQKGATSYLKGIGAFYYVSAVEQSLDAGEKIYDYLTQEQTRLFPRMAFETAGQDLLEIVQGKAESTDRPLTRFERLLQDDVEAIVFIHIPQIPSSRAFGTYPVLTFDDYQDRVPANRSDWQVVPVPPRPFPENFLKGPQPNSKEPFFSSIRILVTLPPIILCLTILAISSHRRRRKK